MKKFLPIGVQNFAQMINGNFVYVDKTRYVYELARVPQAFYFLSRPRRFGKSLLASTFKSLFAGQKELFKELWIANTDWTWKPHPVVIVDFNGIDATNATILEESLSSALDKIADSYGIALQEHILPNKFVELFTELHLKSREKIVVLIDEYDKPIVTHLGKGEAGLQIARENRDFLKKFFGVLKETHVSSILRFVFITGISKFSKAGIFSDLNNLQDLSMHSAYAELLGYTQTELQDCFGAWIEEFARIRQTTTEDILQSLKVWYNGYRFTLENRQVYNPFSILNTFSEYKFKNFWFETATPSFLVNLIKEKDCSLPSFEKVEIQEAAFTTYELENLQLEALLFQTGYLTIHDFDGFLYRLGYPNQEIKNSFLNYLYHRLVELPDTTLKAQYVRLHQYLDREEAERFIATVNAILAAIPYPHIHGQDERYYHTVFYLMLSASGVMVQTEALTSHGRMDVAMEFKDKVYIVELKCNQTAAEAIQQIHQKRYYEKYLQSGRKIYLVGINFDTDERRVTDWRFEALAG
ncbi:MAG: ATP-binding protein [candidate division KSB1 bacterium]|nr:ATP-binding protein [candidate division KSB1 bacterium]MDZ7367945.1 ATP-binding protein [candidate division KSB1 bacterium]MDZ7405568.1 ATP-binding protein [candidate division KSB1 bacterium]